MLVINFLHGLLNSAKKFFIVFIALSSRFFRHFTCIVYCLEILYIIRRISLLL